MFLGGIKAVIAAGDSSGRNSQNEREFDSWTQHRNQIFGKIARQNGKIAKTRCGYVEIIQQVSEQLS